MNCKIEGYLQAEHNIENTKKIYISLTQKEIDKIQRIWGAYDIPIRENILKVNLSRERNFTGLFNQKKIFFCKTKVIYLPEKHKKYKLLYLEYMESPEN